MADNPFDNLDFHAQPQPAQAPAPENPFDQLDFHATGPAANDDMSAPTAFGIGALRGIAPAGGGLAGAGAGAEAGALATAMGGPIGGAAAGAVAGAGLGGAAGEGLGLPKTGVAIGGLIGGVGGFFGGAPIIGGVAGAFLGSGAAGAAQDYGVTKLPDSWRDPLQKAETEAETKHPTASFLGGLLPMAATMSPGSFARGALPENATAIQRIMSNPVTARVFGGALQGGIELGQEKVSGQPTDWGRVAASTAFGLVFNKANRIGERIENFGAAPIRALTGTGAIARPEPRILGEQEAESPTIAQAQDAKIAGPTNTEDVFQGSHNPDPTLQMAAQDLARTEQAIIGEPPQGDIESAARRPNPELFARYNLALEQRDATQRWLQEYQTQPEANPAEVSLAREHLVEADKQVAELAPEISAAYRRAADALGEETLEPHPVPPEAGAEIPPVAGAHPKPTEGETLAEAAVAPKPIAEQKTAIADDMKAQLIKAGRPEDEADAAARLVAARFATRAAHLNLNAEELYKAEGPEIRAKMGIPLSGPEVVQSPEPAPPLPKEPAAATEEALRRLAAPEPEPEAATLRPPTENEIANAKEDRRERARASKAISPEEQSKARAKSDAGGVTKRIIDEIARGYTPEEAAGRLWQGDGFWGQHPNFEWDNENTFARFIENVARSMRVPLDNAELLERWRENWAMREHPNFLSAIETPQESPIVSQEGGPAPVPQEEANEIQQPVGADVRGGTREVPAGEQPETAPEPKPIRNPPRVDPFDGGGSGGTVEHPSVAESRRDEGATVSAESEGATKPPPVSAGVDQARPDTPAASGRAEAVRKIEERSRSNYRITDDDHIGEGGPREKIRANIEAIRTLKMIEDEGREATPEEKKILVKYTGWGAFAQDMFAARRGSELKAERDAFRALATDEEYEAARASTLNAHYTSPEVVKGMWDALMAFGYKGGMAIEPSAGVGHFIGLIPDSVAPKTAWTAVELDPLTGRIAKALYGGAEVNIQGFETLRRPSNYYDLAISNVPFGNFNLTEKPYGSYPIHDFFFVKSLDKVRPGGVVSFITSRYTMDKVDSAIRRKLSESADLIGAIRLPGGSKGAFAGNAGTEVTTDIIFLRKRIPGEPEFGGGKWADLKEIQTPEGPVKINEYFADHPEQMLGEMRLLGSQYRANEPVLIGEPEGLREKIAAAAGRMPAGAFTERASPPPPTIEAGDIEGHVKEGGYFLKDGEIYRKEGGVGSPQKLSPDAAARMKRLIGLRDSVNELLAAQLGRGDRAPEAIRADLQKAYDEFVDKHGPLRKEIRTETKRLDKTGEPIVRISHPNYDDFLNDPDAYKTLAIENYDPETGTATRATIQTQDVISPKTERQINGPSDALAATLDAKGVVDLNEIGQLLGAKSEDEVVARLGDLIFQNPDGRAWETADKYLSGNVVQKLEEAEEIAKTDATYRRNVEALKKVQPKPLTGTDIVAQLGAPWVPPEVYVDFLKHLGAYGPDISIIRTPYSGEWKVSGVRGWGEAEAKYGLGRSDATAEKVIMAALNNKSLILKDYAGRDVPPVVNKEKTEEAGVKIEELRQLFGGDPEAGVDSWAFADPDRATKLEAIYNRTFNTLAPRVLDGSHQTFPGMSAELTLRKHQSDAVWRTVQNGNTLLAHVVGAGKAQPLDAKILTPKGWRRMGDLRRGDHVIAGDGTPTKVLGVYPQGSKPIFRVTFSDGAKTECCDEHLWLTQTYSERCFAQRAKKMGKEWACGAGRVRSLAEIRSSLVAPHLKAKNHSIPIVGRVAFDEKAVPIDPYLMGVLIGDGCMRGAGLTFSTADTDILQAVSDAIPADCEVRHRGSYDYAIVYTGKMAYAVGGGAAPSHPIKTALVNLGLWGKYAHEKCVPESFLFNTPSVRLAVLQGLMDTDGTVNRNGTATTFTTTSPQLAEDVSEIVRSLGGVVRLTQRTPKFGRLAFTLSICLPPDVMPFRLNRKAARVAPKTKYAPARYIVSVEPVGEKLAQCIAVEHPSHLYVTDDFIVTHNTFTMVASGMEQKRLGLINKPAYAVPNHMLDQFSTEFLQAYPNAKILVASKEEMSEADRKAFVAKVAANDWDGVIFTHSGFGRIAMSREARERFIRNEIDEIIRAGEAAAAEEGKKSPTVKDLEKARKRAQTRLDKLLKEEGKDEGTTFEETGIDHVFVDEAHLFKNLSFATRFQRVKGLATQPSQRASDLFMKIQFLEQKRPGRSAVFATGTPVSNTMAELWTMMRYLELNKLKERGLDQFDAWASTFGKTVTEPELASDGRSLKDVTRFAKFVNVPELISLYSEIADTKTADMLNLPRPELVTPEGRKGITIVQAQPSEKQETYIQGLIQLAKTLKGPVEKGKPNMASITTLGRMVAADERLAGSGSTATDRAVLAMNPDLQGRMEFNPEGKIAKAIANISRIYKEGKGNAKAQMVFLDVGTPKVERKAAPPKEIEGESDLGEAEEGVEAAQELEEAPRVNLYDDIKGRLIQEGIPAKEIAFIHDADTDAKKKALFQKVRDGAVRVLIGSTEKMGVGTNVQRQLIAMHHLDAPWKPAEVEQRDGRILRQGNLNPEVQIYRYITERTFDAFSWQTLEKKAKFIGQVLSGAKGSRIAEDFDNPLPEAEQLKAAASGDPRIMQHAELTRQVRQLAAQRRAFENTRQRATWETKQAQSNVDRLQKELPTAKADAAKVEDLSGDKFKVTIGGEEFTDRKAAGLKALAPIIRQDPGNFWRARDFDVGQMAGFRMSMEVKGAYADGAPYLQAVLKLHGDADYQSPTAFVINDKTDPVGLMVKFQSMMRAIGNNAQDIENKISAGQGQIEKLKGSMIGTWPRETEYKEAQKKLADLTQALKPPKPGEEAKKIEAPSEQELAQEETPRELSQSVYGKIKFTPGNPRAVITLMSEANASTFVHELGHDFLEQLMRDATHEAAPDVLKADAETVRKWIGAKEGQPIPTRGHEKFARGFEQYLREGVAPTKELAGVFAKFRNWLLGVYQTIKGLGAPITDDIRGVFDRLLNEGGQPTVIAPGRQEGLSLAAIHERDAAETSPQHAEPAADRIVAEATQQEAELRPEIQNELAPIVAKDTEAAAAESAGAGAGPSGETGPGAGEPGQVGEGGGNAGTEPAGGAGGEKSGEIVGGGGKPLREGGNLSDQSGSEQRPLSGRLSRNEQPIPTPATVFEPGETPRVDKAGNIRLDNLTTSEDVAKAIRESAERNNDFIGDRRGVITDGQVMELADALGMDVATLSRRQLGQAFNAEQIMAARKLLIQSATEVHEAMKKAAEGSDEDVMAYALARDRHQMIQGQVAGITAEAGRALRAFRNISGAEAGEKEALAVDQFIKQATGRTLYQMRREAKMGSALDTPEKVSEFVDKARKNAYADMVLEYWINCLISGVSTHVTYSMANAVLAAVKAGPDTLAAAAIGALRGRENRVYAGEALEQFRAMGHLAPGMKAGAEAVREGLTAKLPGETSRNVLPFSPGAAGVAPQTDVNATYGDAAAASFSILQGIRDGMLSGGALLKAGGVEGESGWGVRRSNLGAIPDITFRGVGVLPVGTMARVPSRMIAGIHSFFRATNYSMELASLSYRQAMQEGLQGEAFASRVAELRTNPPEEMMKAAREAATDLTLMGPGGDFTRNLDRLMNTRIGGVKFLKFIDPFVHISSNIIQKGLIERTPIGLALSSELRADLAGRNGEIAQDIAMARMLVGSAFAIGFGGLAASGYASGSGPSDPRQAAMWRLAGNQAHSIRIGDIWYDIHRLGPMGMLLSTAADMYEVSHIAAQGDLLKAGATLQHAITQNILDESFMRGPSDLIKAVDDPGRYGQAYIRNWASSFVPYSVGLAQAARAMDPYTRQARTMTEAIKAKIPGWSETLMPRRDVWGEPIPSRDALVAAGLTAIYETQMSRDPVNLALLNLGIAPSQVPRLIRNVQLDEQQYDDFARIAGRMTKQRLDVIVGSPMFAQWPAHVQHDVIQETIRGCREAARGQMMQKYPAIMRQATQNVLDRIHKEPESID